MAELQFPCEVNTEECGANSSPAGGTLKYSKGGDCSLSCGPEVEAPKAPGSGRKTQAPHIPLQPLTSEYLVPMFTAGREDIPCLLHESASLGALAEYKGLHVGTQGPGTWSDLLCLELGAWGGWGRVADLDAPGAFPQGNHPWARPSLTPTLHRP